MPTAPRLIASARRHRVPRGGRRRTRSAAGPLYSRESASVLDSCAPPTVHWEVDAFRPGPESPILSGLLDDFRRRLT